MTNGKNGTGKMVGLVALGAVANSALYYFTQKYATQSVPVDKMTFQTADAVATGAGVATIGAGMLAKKPGVSLVGAGALAVALAALVTKPLSGYNLSASATANSANTTYAGVHSPRSSPTAPPANPQQMLVAGYQSGGGKAVYKSPSTGKVDRNYAQLIIG
jgi:hypothetical protein